MMNRYVYRWLLLLASSVYPAAHSVGQTAAVPVDASQSELRQRLDRLIESVDAIRQQIQDSQQQMQGLSSQIRSIQNELAGRAEGGSPDSRGNSGPAGALNAAVDDLREQSELQQSEIKVHEQTKVETASKYPVRITGMLLFSSFLNNGAVDNIDSPVLALPSSPSSSDGNLAATLRQTSLGLEATGPHLWGARSSADMSVDFFGDTDNAARTTNLGALRLRAAHVALDWPGDRISFALDRPLISPRQPTSLLSQSVPALAWSGNLWSWSPQFEYKRKQNLRKGTATAQFGLIDSFYASPSATAAAGPGPGESSRQPGYEARLAYTFGTEPHPISFGAGGYYSRQKYAYGQHLDTWAATGDWSVPLNRFFEITGEVYRGRGLASLGAGVYKDYYIASGNSIRALNDEGGWTQLKFEPARVVEANAAIGLDNGFAEDLAYASPPSTGNPYSSLARNRTVLANLIFRPRPYLLFSTEYRFIESWPSVGNSSTAHSVGLGAGYVF